MVICTKSADQICRQAFAKNEVSISRFSQMLDSFCLDPSISMPPREAFIVMSDDIKSPKVRSEFTAAASNKHPNVKIIVIDKTGKGTVPTGNGVDVVLAKPTPALLQQTVYDLIASIAEKPEVLNESATTADKIDKFNPEFLNVGENEGIDPFAAFGSGSSSETTSAPTSTTTTSDSYFNPDPDVAGPVEPDVLPLPEIEEEPVEDVEEPIPATTNELADRLNECRRIADVSALASEFDAARIMQKLNAENQTYSALEVRLKAIEEMIFSIMHDPSITSLEDRLTKVRAVIYDQEYYAGKTNTLIEQRVEEIIRILTDKVNELYKARLEELDRAIINASKHEIDPNKAYATLVGIGSERANIILELATMDMEIKQIYGLANNAAVQIASEMATKTSNPTGSEVADMQIMARGDMVKSEDSINAALGILELADTINKEGEMASIDINTMLNKIHKLMELDKEEIAAQKAIIDFLTTNNLLNTPTATTLIKKSCRVFMGPEGSGRTIVPYILSKLKSRENANVLLVDITGTSKLDDYGIKALELDSLLNGVVNEQLCIVAGELPNTPSAAQRFLVALEKSADYYRVINIVMRPDQREIFDTIINDMLCVNYITDTSTKNLELTKQLLVETRQDNVRQRVIVNCCDVPSGKVVSKLDLMDRVDTGLVTIPTISQISCCALNNDDPSIVNTVQEAFREVTKYA